MIIFGSQPTEPQRRIQSLARADYDLEGPGNFAV
jgi:hypothetical protein